MSNSVRPHRWQPNRLPHPWDSPGKNIGVGCHFLLQCMKVKNESEVAQSCLTLSDPIDCSLPGSSIRGIFQARVPEWGTISFSEKRGYFFPFIRHAVLRQGGTIATDASVQKREEWKGDGSHTLKLSWNPARHRWPVPFIQEQGSFPVFLIRSGSYLWLIVFSASFSHINLWFQNLLFILNYPIPLVPTGGVFA